MAPAWQTAPRTLEQAYWEADRGVALADFTVGALLADRARAHPDRIAVVGVRHGTDEKVRLTYRQLFTEASRVAAGLLHLTERGSHVALWAPNVIEWPIVQYGAALAGMVLVALNPALREEELEYALSHSKAPILLHADVSRDYRMSDVATRLSRALPGLRCVSLSDTATWQADDDDGAAAACAPHDPDRVAMLQFTSGTTGRPKGVPITHRAMVNVAKLTLEAVQAPPGAVCLNPLPLFHTAGCVIATLGPLWIGGTVVLVDRFAPGPVLKALREEDVAVLFYVPAVLGALLESQRASGDSAPQLHTIMGGASNVPAAMIADAEQTFGATIINLFGQTELSPVLTATRPGDSVEDRLATVGRPLPQVDCKIVDPVTNETVAVDRPGEICARGYQQFTGYLHDPDATAQAVDADGFVHTGDLGTMDSRGYLTVTGRLKELIIRNGENIAAAEIESVVVDHESIVEAAVVGLPDERLGEMVVAVIRLRGDAEPDLKARLIDHAGARLAPFKVPGRWFLAEQLPVTQTGKVRKFELRDAILREDLPEL